MALKISDTWLKKQAAPAVGATTYWDLDITGFGVRIFAPTRRHEVGARSFFVNYRVGGREKRFTIGSYPDWSAEAARAEAKELRRRIDRGEDPALARKTQREAPTVRDLAHRYKDEHLPKKADSSQVNDWAMIENEILPAIGERKVADVHERDIEALHRAITERGRAVRANRVLAVASKMFSLTLRRKEGEDAPWRDQAQGNPCKGVARNHEEGHERFFSPAELAALGDALESYGQDFQPPIVSESSCSLAVARARPCWRLGISSRPSPVFGSSRRLTRSSAKSTVSRLAPRLSNFLRR